jgi:WD40 repeat protein
MPRISRPSTARCVAGGSLLPGLAVSLALMAAMVCAAAAPSADWIKPLGEPKAIDAAAEAITAMAVSADGKQLIVDTEPALFFLDTGSGKPARASMPAHRDTSGLAAPTAIVGRLFVTTWANVPSADKSGRTAPRQVGELLALDVTTKKSQRLLELKKEPHVIAASADGKRVALGYSDGTVHVVDGASGKSLLGPVKLIAGIVIAKELVDGTTTVSALAFSPDGARLVVAGEDVTLRVIEVSTGKTLTQFVYGGVSGSGTHTPAQHVAFTPDGSRLVTAAQDRNLSLHDAATSQVLGDAVRVPGGVSALAIGADGKTVYTGDNDGRLQRWELRGR